MDFLDKSIEKYAESLSDSESELLTEIHKYTLSKVHQPRMISGHLQGRFLSFVSRMVRPQNILEIGTYTGYSALCLAEGLHKKGRLITIDRDKSLKEKVSNFFNKSIFKNQIEQKLGNAIDIIPKLKFKFDLIFIDADKKNYKNYFDSVLPKLNKGGVIIVDNVLWRGKVTQIKKFNYDKIAKYMDEFNRYVNDFEGISKLILPVRDGLTLIIKNE
tara:strand:- start:12944 stop:13591 length:648 start_codon:yes stop_codon:yes gene_type:complete